MKKESEVVMLPTDKAENCILKHEGGLGMGHIKGFHSQGYLKSNNETSHHLYFTSDEEIEVGCHVLFSDVVFKCHAVDDKVVGDDEGNTFMKVDCKKIIGTTDESLSIKMEQAGNNVWTQQLPHPSQAFIERFCKVGGIWKVMVEYELQSFGALIEDSITPLYLPKVDSHNEITIHPVKEKVYSREEVITILKECCGEVSCEDGKLYGKDPHALVSWIKENL